MRKIVFSMLLALTLVFVSSQSNQAEAREVYMGNYSDGSAVYLLTEAINIDGDRCNCTVRAGRDYLQYYFHSDGTYSNSEGYSGSAYDGRSPVARAIYQYIRNHY